MENQGPNNNEYRNPFEPDNGENGNNNNNNDNGNKKNRNGQTIMYFVVIDLVFLFIFSIFSNRFSKMSNKETTYTEFLEQIEAGNVKTIEYKTYEIHYTLVKDTAKYDVTYYTGNLNDPELFQQLKGMKTSEGEKIEIKAAVPDNTSTWIINILSFVIPLIFIWIIM